MRKGRLVLKYCFVLGLCLYSPMALLAQGKSRKLDDYLEAAVKNSPLLKDYARQLLTNRLDSLQIVAQNRPQVNGNAQALYQPDYGRFGYDAAVTNGGNWMAQISATQNILNGRLLKPQYESVNIQGKLLANTSKMSEHDLKHTITAQYITVWSDEKQLANTKQISDLMNAEDKIMRPLVKSGILKQTAYLSFSMEMQTQALNLNQGRIQYETDLMTLNILCGLQDTATDITLKEPDLAENDVAHSYFSSPYYMQYHIDSLSIINQRQLINMRYKPHLTWVADAGFLSSTPDLYMHPGFSIGLGLVVPVFDGHQKDIDYQRLTIREKTRIDYVNYNKRQYDMQYLMLNKELDDLGKLVSMLGEQLKSSDQLIDMSRKELDAGDITVTDFIVVLRSHIDIENNLNMNQVKTWQIINDLNYYNW